MGIYNIDYNKVGSNMLPPYKRTPTHIAWVKSLLSPIQYLRDLIFDTYIIGSFDPLYIVGSYGIGQRVIYAKSVYESLANGNVANPIDTNFWRKVSDNFIGVNERVLYNGQKIILEFALNKNFNTSFRQPPNVSDIYITNIAPVLSGFMVGQSVGSAVGQTDSVDKVGLPNPFIQLVNFTIHIPAAAYALTSNQEINNFVNLYIPASINFTITVY